MKKLALDKWERRPYGEKTDGSVSVNGRSVNITVRRPLQETTDSLLYVMANGWTAGKNSMRVPAHEAAKHGHTAVTFRYTNTHAKGALEENVRDMSAVMDALPSYVRRGAIGLSMGGAVVTMAMDRLDHEIERATLVAPGKYLHPDYYSPRIILQHMLSEPAEALQFRGRWGDGLRLLGTGAINCLQRPQAVRAELRELLDGNVHQELIRVKQRPDAPFIRFMYGLNDRLLPAFAQLESVAGLPFDDIRPFEGEHARLAYDPTLANQIFSLDETGHSQVA
jgi:pimeloyl-ACP methyl ester carboxylesterase